MTHRSFRFALALAVLVAAGLFAFTIAQETPVGTVKGRVVAQETGNPLVASVTLTPNTGLYDEVTCYNTESKRDGGFDFRRIPAGDYKLTISSKAHGMEPVKITVEESKTANIEAELKPASPYLNLYIHQHIFTPDEKPQITCGGFMNSDALVLRLYKVDLNAFLVNSSGSMERLLGLHSYYSDSRKSANVNLNDNRALTLTKTMFVPINSRDLEGIFNQRVDMPVMEPGLYVASLKSEGFQELGWLMVTSIGLVSKTSGSQTLAYAVDLKTGAPVPGTDVSAYVDSKEVASGRTTVDGTLALAVPSSNDGSREQLLVARKGDSAAFVSSWYEGGDSSNSVVYGYTDRPVYRPGQKVYFKGIIRRQTPTGYAVASSLPVTIEVRDPKDTLIYKTTARTNRYGSYNGSFDLNPETATGYYTISTIISGEQDREPVQFQVAAYKKPEFSVKVSFPKKRYTRGEIVKANVSAQYYFGAPVPNAKVRYVVSRVPYWLFTDEEEDYLDENPGYQDYGGYGDVVTESEVTTDANGNAVIEAPADWPQPEGEYAWDSDQQFTIEATVIDRVGRDATGTGSVVATRGEFAIDVTPDRYVAEPGAKVNVAISAVDYDHHPMKSQGLAVKVARVKWTRDGSSVETLKDAQVTTDNAGHASIPVEISRSGEIRIEVWARDGRRNKVISEAYVWSYSEAYEDEGYGSYPDLQIITDKKVYNAGDTAKALINTKTPGATALVTVEGSRIYDSQTVRLTGKSTLVKIPITKAYRPNFYISVCYVKDKQFASQEARARVSLGTQELRVQVAPDKSKYKPGEAATYKIKTTDANGKSAQAEVSIGVVDEAIYAIAEDDTPAMLGYFYARKANAVSTNFSFPQIYLSDPDKAGAPVANKPRMEDIRVRKRFLDTAYWNPSVLTDGKGEATVSFQLPDNLTTWRATVRGITLDTMCGEAKNTVLSRQDFMVRLETPRFMVQTDSATITTAVHNYTGRDQNVDLLFESAGLTLDGKATRRVRVRNGEIARVNWQISAPKPGEFLVSVKASGDSAGDAMQTVLPVYPHGVERRTMTTGSLSGSSTSKDTIIVRSDAIPGTTRLQIRLAPSLASAMLGSLEYLAQYPYGCTEQTTSSFLPDVILSKSFKALGQRNAKLEKQLPDMVQNGLFRLYRFQLTDGGWGWSEYGEDDPWMTAYVCYGLIQARDAGFAVNEDILNNGLRRLGEILLDSRLPADTKAFAYYVQALSGGAANAGLDNLARSPVLSSKALALLALAFQHTGQKDNANLALKWLLDHAVVESGMMHWDGAEKYHADDVETTALALQASLKANPSDPRAIQIVRWLMEQRQSDCWYSTRDTAMVLYAMAEFFKASNELAPDFSVTVLVNGKPVGGKHFTKADIFEPEFVVTSNGLLKGRNNLEIRKIGVGNMYVTTSLRQYLAKDLTPTVVSGGGVSISRKYYWPLSSYYDASSDKEPASPIWGCRTGDVVLVRLTVNSSKYVRHLLVEDTIPAGCEIMDRGRVNQWDWYDWWVGQDVRDEKISFYVEDLQPGKHILTYQMRAGFAGDYHALPAQVFAMYQPEIRAATAELEFSIR